MSHGRCGASDLKPAVELPGSIGKLESGLALSITGMLMSCAAMRMPVRAARPNSRGDAVQQQLYIF